MTIYFLYKKTHNVTGLMYLGQTKKDPFIYKGSGKRWKRHLRKHGNNVTTEILHEVSDLDELRRLGLEYSKKWNIVESDQWANLRPESGEGVGFIMWSDEMRSKASISATGRKMSAEARRKMSIARRGKKRGPHSVETIAKIRASYNPASNLVGRKHAPCSADTKEKIRLALKGKPWSAARRAASKAIMLSV